MVNRKTVGILVLGIQWDIDVIKFVPYYQCIETLVNRNTEKLVIEISVYRNAYVVLYDSTFFPSYI